MRHHKRHDHGMKTFQLCVVQACVSYGVTAMLVLFVVLLYICGCPFIRSESEAILDYEATLRFLV